MIFRELLYDPLSEWNLRQFWNITSGIYAKIYHVRIMLLFVYTTTRKRFVIFTCRYFKLSWNTTALPQSNCRNFSCSRINTKIIQFTSENTSIIETTSFQSEIEAVLRGKLQKQKLLNVTFKAIPINHKTDWFDLLFVWIITWQEPINRLLSRARAVQSKNWFWLVQRNLCTHILKSQSTSHQSILAKSLHSS